MSTRPFIAFAILFLSFLVKADPAASTKPALTLTDLAIFSEAVVVAHAGVITEAPKGSGGAIALWIEKSLKGRLQGGRDVIWIPRNELPKAEVGGTRWLLFLTQFGDKSWHVQTGNSEKNLITIDSLDAPVLAEVKKAIGSYGPAAGPGPASADEAAYWINKAARGDRSARQEAFADLIAAGESARSELIHACSAGDRETAAVGRTLLPLAGSGPEVNGLRLILDTSIVELCAGNSAMISVNYANLTTRDITLVTGTSAHGDNVLSAAAYELRPIAEVDGKKAVAQAPLPTVLPGNFGATIESGAPALPIIRVVPTYSVLPLTVQLQLESVVLDGKPELRLKFPHGYIALPGPGKYNLAVRFSGPGPRPDQRRLIDANYWRGGQLVSNPIQLIVK